MGECSWMILGFSFFLLPLLLLFFSWRGALDSDYAAKLVGLGFIVGAGLFLVASGKADSPAAAPVIGLLGTGLGFLFGRSVSEEKKIVAAARRGVQGGE